MSSAMHPDIRQYLVITGAYWAFTLTDGAIRMLVVLYFHLLGYSPLQVALLFLFYELFGVITNLVGGWLGSRIGLDRTQHLGMALQVIALGLLTVPDSWLSVPYVMAAQALSGIAKDLNKMSAKAGVKSLVSGDQPSRLFRWVALLTGSKNALKGLGFFLGAGLLQWLGFRGALLVLSLGLLAALLASLALLPHQAGAVRRKAKFSQLLSHNTAINWLSAARFFLFGARDVWFVVALPVFLYDVLEWSFMAVGMVLAAWTIGYGVVQATAPRLLRRSRQQPGPAITQAWGLVLALVPAAIALTLPYDTWQPALLVGGLVLFGVVFAINSALHSYLILAYAEQDKVALNVGFYYMANAGGRLAGTVLSGWLYQIAGLDACLWSSAAMVMLAVLLSLRLPQVPTTAAAAS
jgi:predicted MFS family arabinose efflux permease